MLDDSSACVVVQKLIYHNLSYWKTESPTFSDPSSSHIPQKVKKKKIALRVFRFVSPE
jgi:dethiobiotin synthetase